MSIKREEKNILRWAKDGSDNRIHISNAISGRNGYRCIDCNVSMQANIGNKLLTPYFSHDPIDRLEKKVNCSFSDESYRHEIAKEILQRIKCIKVPSVYKFPPAGILGNAKRLSEAREIKAHSVKNEYYVYEEEDGSIQHGDTKKESPLLIKPDVAFLNEKGDPILLIEIVATHKVDKEKLFKIMALGIDTIQVSIPAHFNEEAIENNFKITDNTEWLYNYDQQHADYFQLPERNSERIPDLNEFERRTNKELVSYECTTFQIKQLAIRIRKCLQSEQYLATAKGLADSLLRTQENTERVRDDKRQLCWRIEEQVYGEFEGKGREVETEEGNLGEEEAEFERRHGELQKEIDREIFRLFETEEGTIGYNEGNLEKRYQSKDSELAGEERELRTKERDLEDEERWFRAGCQDEIDKLEGEISQIEGTGEGGIDGRIEHIKKESREIGEQIESIEGNIRDTEFNTQILSLTDGFDPIDLRKEFDRFREQSIRAIKDRDIVGNLRVSRRIKAILEERKLLDDFVSSFHELQRNKRAKEVLRQKLYKTWI